MSANKRTLTPPGFWSHTPGGAPRPNYADRHVQYIPEPPREVVIAPQEGIHQPATTPECRGELLSNLGTSATGFAMRLDLELIQAEAALAPPEAAT